MNSTITFLKAIDNQLLTMFDRALAAIWHAEQHGAIGLTAREICTLIEQSGHPGQNISRLETKLASARKQVSRVPNDSKWRLHPYIKQQMDAVYAERANSKPKPVDTDSVLPPSLFKNTRKYLERVVFQINASFDYSLFDCCAVMCRRLLETLIIEVYEANKQTDKIKDSGGNFFMFSDLQRILLTDEAFHLSRNTKQALKDFKKLGDLSAHSRRYNALQSDIENIKLGMRIASEELLHLANLA